MSIGYYKFKDGSEYTGELKGRHPNGKGKTVFLNGDSYEGEYVKGKRQGQGTYLFSDGEKYVGEWYQDQQHGKGTYCFMNNNRYDGMIITGAPVETMDFEQVDYWPELCEIMDFSETNVYSTLHVCWGAQAGLYYHYGIRKELLHAKMFGVFEHRVIRPSNPLVRGFDEVFYAPHSRHTAMSREDIDHCGALRILAESDEAGPFLMSTENGRQIFVIGHPEYDKYTLDAEYKRDVAKGLPIAVPKNYYPNDDPSQPPLFRWRAHAHLLYENWLNYYVYQNTPYDLGEMQRVKHSEG